MAQMCIGLKQDAPCDACTQRAVDVPRLVAEHPAPVRIEPVLAMARSTMREPLSAQALPVIGVVRAVEDVIEFRSGFGTDLAQVGVDFSHGLMSIAALGDAAWFVIRISLKPAFFQVAKVSMTVEGS